MRATSRPDESIVAAVCAALSPYPWRSFTPDLLARTVLAAKDRHVIRDLLQSVPGAAVGTWEAAEPAEPDDARTDALVNFLSSHRWAELRLSTVCRQLLGGALGAAG